MSKIVVVKKDSCCKVVVPRYVLWSRDLKYEGAVPSKAECCQGEASEEFIWGGLNMLREEKVVFQLGVAVLFRQVMIGQKTVQH